MSDSPCFTLFNEYPILQLTTIGTNGLGFLPIVCFLYIAQIAPLHTNCRFLLCVWALSFGVIYSINFVISIIDISSDTGHMPLNMFEPHLRLIMYRFHITTSTFCSMCEIALSLERIIAIIRPRRYHFSNTSWSILLPLTTGLTVFGYFVDYCIHNG
ncbi:hypothetical protein PMAYCL1PPCAC_14966 [Pristionchus mayeri]|uniref:G protein-coupled receptor n=1 Tax=Pristionchus mayeri TaxID=1317129 RepID=A0AAN5CI12_9BILA|nr:hypothetical protein PMAYCL1PPCAC_14966 [Pristionchus mayeri]